MFGVIEFPRTKQRWRNKLCFAEKINQENIRCGLAGLQCRWRRWELAGRRILTKFNKQRQLITQLSSAQSSHTWRIQVSGLSRPGETEIPTTALYLPTPELCRAIHWMETEAPWSLAIVCSCVDWLKPAGLVLGTYRNVIIEVFLQEFGFSPPWHHLIIKILYLQFSI